MTNLERYTQGVFCQNGNKEDFLKLLTTLVYFDNLPESYIEISCFEKKYYFHKKLKTHTLNYLLEYICERFQPQFSRPSNNNVPRISGITFLVKLSSFYQYYPSARERMNAKLWAIKTLDKYQMPSRFIEDL